MSNWDNYDDPNDGNTGGQGLRAQLEKALADKKAAEQERDQLRSKIAERDGADALQDKVANPAKVARLAIKDGVDMSDSTAVEKWLEENDGLFVPAPKSNQPDASDAGDAGDLGDADQTDSVVPAGMENAFGLMTQIHAAASPALVNKYEAALAGLPADASDKQVLDAFRAAGL